MTAFATQHAPTARVRTYTATPVLRRKCACGGTPGPTGECEQCRKKRLGLQRSASATGPALAPPIVHDVLRSPGRPLDAATRADLEPRFGHSFADIRVHEDDRAAESAAAVGARAYTVSRDVVFGAGRYAPGSADGRRLLAHELAHVVQQAGSSTGALRARLEIGPVDDPLEREADAAADAAMSSAPRPVLSGAPPASAATPVVRRVPEEPTDTVQPAAVAEQIEMKKKLDDGRYGCFCGVGECEGGEPINDLDRCCMKHDIQYDALDLTGSKPGAGEISMWSREGFIRSRKFDLELVGCAIGSRKDRTTMDLPGRATRALAVSLYSLRAAYATKLWLQGKLDSIGE
jgi:hypothetical protein